MQNSRVPDCPVRHDESVTTQNGGTPTANWSIGLGGSVKANECTRTGVTIHTEVVYFLTDLYSTQSRDIGISLGAGIPQTLLPAEADPGGGLTPPPKDCPVDSEIWRKGVADRL